MAAISSLLWFVAVIFGVGALFVAALFIARLRYLKTGQEEGE